MSAEAASRRARPATAPALDRELVLRYGREVVAAEAGALQTLVDRLDDSFVAAVDAILRCRGSLIVTGIGKAGLIGQKLVATFASTGARAHFLHPAEAFHGDLGRLHADDVVLALSQSGETAEVLQLLPALRSLGVRLIAMTASAGSTLGRSAATVLALGRLDEACSLGLAPSTSTTVMLALGDALALVVSRLRGFTAEDFARFHPGGALGLKLSAVDDHMRPLSQCRVARANQTVRQVVLSTTRPGRRSGAIMLVDETGRLVGLFTDSDLARLIERRHEAALDQLIHAVMASAPTSVESGTRLAAAIEILTQRKFSELPVVDRHGRPLGMIDVTDMVGLMPRQQDPHCPEPGDVPQHAPVLRLFSGVETTPEAEFVWPYAEMPETD
ncbi:MAG TPA: KpsF/GutQ family sugar-phosphate isomerase [Lacipirellulaceae bacterium]|nr:KpsF/GutQ family sugar-phosphate isomerase [Lacipirellulaceae bacterium]